MVRSHPCPDRLDPQCARVVEVGDARHDDAVNQPAATVDTARLHRNGVRLERITLGWNIVGVIVLTISATRASSVALAGFGLDSLIEMGASTVVLWELSGAGEARQQRALRLIGGAFVALAIYLLAQSSIALLTGHHATHSTLGIVWTAMTAAVMFTLAAGKTRTGRALDNPVLATGGKVTIFIDGVLAVAVMTGISLNVAVGWWWADPAAGLVIVYYATREAQHIFIDNTGSD